MTGKSRYLVALLGALILFQAGFREPAFVSAQEPTSSPPTETAPPPSEAPASADPSPGAEPSPSADPSPQPDASPELEPTPAVSGEPTSEPAPGETPGPESNIPPVDNTPPGIERVELRTAASRTFEQPDGRLIVELFSAPIHFQPEGSAEWQPIDLRFAAPVTLGATASVSASPARISLFPANHPQGFLSLDGGGHSISFGLPLGVAPSLPAIVASVAQDGAYAEYADLLPGGIALRVLPDTDGFKSFLVLPQRPATNQFSIVVRTGDLALVDDGDGSFSFRDAAGNVVGRLPRPFMLDSSEVEGRGGGLYSEAVTQTVTQQGDEYLLTLTVDQVFLDSAVYPVYLDPTTTTFPTGSTTAQDTFASSKYPGSNFNTYRRPDAPTYWEMWHGNEPGTSYYNEIYIRFNDLEATLGSTNVDSALLQMYPYWQYTHSTPKNSHVERIAADWLVGDLTWNNRPATDGLIVTDETAEDVWSDFNVTSAVQDVVNGVYPNHGFMIHNNDTGQTGWKRFVSRNESNSTNLRPKLVVTVTPFAGPSVFYPNSATGETSTRTPQWTLPAASTQGAYEAQIATNSTFTTGLVSSGTVSLSTPVYYIPTTTTLTDGQLYYWRVRAKFGNNTSFSAWSDTGSFIYRQGATLGLPGHNSFESFDLGNGDQASVNVSTANLVISHPIVSLPMRGGAFDLSLTYNSQSTANAGTGPAWRLDAMRRLTELAGGNVVFTAGDGSVHTFTKISTVGTVTTYTRPATIYATLRKDTVNALEWTLTYRDQSVDSFDVVGSEGLLAKQADRFGNAVTFTYSAGTNRLSQATDPNGRVVDFAWNTSVSPARLTSITDWAYVSGGVVQSSATGSRRAYRLFYDASGRLVGWSNPLNTSGSCPTQASNLTCLTYDANNGLVAAIAKTQTITTLASGSLGTSSRTVTTTIGYRGGEVAEIKDAEQTFANATGTTFTRTEATKMQVVRQGTPASTTTYGFVAATDTLGRLQSSWRKLGTTDIEQRTAWDSTYPTQPASVTDNYGALLSTPARTVSYAYVASSMGLVSITTEPLTGSTNRTTTYTYNPNNDVTQVVVAGPGGATTTRYCYTTSGCSTSGNTPTLNSVIENYVDGAKGGATGNVEDVTTDYLYDANGQLTRETRWNYNDAGTLLDSRSIAYTYDANGYPTATIANYSDGDTADPYDAAPDPATGARTDLTTTFTYNTAGNHISSADPRRALMASPGADDYVTRWEFDALNRETKSTVARDPADASTPRSSTSTYDQLGELRQSTDYGGVVSAIEYDRAGRATATFEDTPTTAAEKTGATTYDAAGRVLTQKDRNQVGDANLGRTISAYDELGRLTEFTDASGSSPDVSSTTRFAYDALDRQTSVTFGYGDPSAMTTDTAYDLGGRATQVDDEFACSATTYDYRDLALTETSGLAGGTCASDTDTRTLANSYDALGRLTRSEVTSGADATSWTFAAELDSAGRELKSGFKDVDPATVAWTTLTLNPLDQVLVEARPDGATNKSNYDAAGNPTDRCYWKPGVTVGDCYEQGHANWTNPPSQVTTSVFDARNNQIELRNSSPETTTTYDPEHNYAIKAFYVPTSSGREHQTLYVYDGRHRLATVNGTPAIRHQLCVLDTSTTAAHDCTSTTTTGSDSYAYDDNDNRTTVNESNGAASSDQRYCYDALNRLQYRNTGAACSSTAKNESYIYDAAGNRTQAVIGGTTTNFAYNAQGQLCKVGATSCGTPNVTYDTAGRTASLSGWTFEYDAEGRLVRACESASCPGSNDRVEFSYDGEGHRTQIKEYTAGVLTTTRDFRYQGDAIVEESTNGSVSRGYVVDEAGRVIRFCDPSCASTTASYLVTWNGHGDALAAWRINADGTLTLANSYTYATWGAPTTTTHNAIADLGFRFLYVGAHDVQWDNFSGLGLLYMHARHYSPAVGRFLQPDPAHAEMNLFAYAEDSPVTKIDPSGLVALEGDGGGSDCRSCIISTSRKVLNAAKRDLLYHRATTVRQAGVRYAVAMVPDNAGRNRAFNDLGRTCNTFEWGVGLISFGLSGFSLFGATVSLLSTPITGPFGPVGAAVLWNISLAGFAFSTAVVVDCATR